jgi:hypothetical protein
MQLCRNRGATALPIFGSQPYSNRERADCVPQIITGTLNFFHLPASLQYVVTAPSYACLGLVVCRNSGLYISSFIWLCQYILALLKAQMCTHIMYFVLRAVHKVHQHFLIFLTLPSPMSALFYTYP